MESFSSGWSQRRRNKVAVDATSSVVRDESTGFSQVARCRSKIQSAAVGSADRCEGIVGRKSLDHYRARFSPRSCRCSRANVAREQETVPPRRTKARSRFQFGRALAANYSGRRALLHACRCAVDATACLAKTTVERLTFRASRGGSSSREAPCNASITNEGGRPLPLPLPLMLHALSIAEGPEG